MGGLYVNQFNRFGRQWRVFVEAEAADRIRPGNPRQYYVRNRAGAMVPLSTLVTTNPPTGPEYTNRFNLYRAAQVNWLSGAGLQLGPGAAALEEVARETLPARWATTGLIFRIRKTKRRDGGADLRAVIAGRVPDSGGAYESWTLPFSVLLSRSHRNLWRLRGPLFAALRLRYLRADRPRDADRAGREERDSDRGVRTRRNRGAATAGECGSGRSEAAAAPDFDDVICLHFGLRAPWIASGSGARRTRILGTVVVTGMFAATALAIFIIPVLFVLL